jgi:hypothetical protein
LALADEADASLVDAIAAHCLFLEGGVGSIPTYDIEPEISRQMQSYQASSSVFDEIPFKQFSPHKAHLCSEYQIDFFPNGKGGATICLRYGSPGNYRIMVYDGGTPRTGRQLIEHIRGQYGTDVVDDVICSHPNADQCLGLCDIVEEMDVRCLWMNRPWHYSPAIASYFRRKHIDSLALAAHFDERFAIPYILEDLAVKRGIPVCEPFQGAQIGPFTVMSPHRDWYVNRAIPAFGIPLSVRRLAATAPDQPSQSASMRFINSLTQPFSREGRYISAESESSVVLFGEIGGQGILLTGDAGIMALSNTARYADKQCIPIPTNLRLVQMPYHCNNHRLSSSLLDRLVGPEWKENTINRNLTALVFMPAESNPFSNRLLVHALVRRGARVVREDAGKGHAIYPIGEANSWAVGTIRLSSDGDVDR